MPCGDSYQIAPDPTDWLGTLILTTIVCLVSWLLFDGLLAIILGSVFIVSGIMNSLWYCSFQRELKGRGRHGQ
jgi:hypothetical protein